METLTSPADIAYATLYINLGRARTALQQKDTPANRQAVADALAAFDREFDGRNMDRLWFPH